MFKRIRWVSLGVAIGCAGTLWAERKARSLVGRVMPDRLADPLATRARAAGSDLRDALSVGRQAMRDREGELRAQFDRTERLSRHHPSIAHHDHPSVPGPHLHLVEDAPLTGEERARQR